MNNVIVISLLARPAENSLDDWPKLVVSIDSSVLTNEADVQNPVKATALTVTTGFDKYVDVAMVNPLTFLWLLFLV